MKPRNSRRDLKAMMKFGYGKGALTKAVEEDILKWISFVEEETITFEGDPVEAIDGILSEIDINSVIHFHQRTQKCKLP